jgi:predicted component of type VI protein secretion system
MAKFFLGFGLSEGFSVEVPDGKVVFGRGCSTQSGESGSIDLTSLDSKQQVSLRHATVTIDGDKMLLQDEASTNGTYLINPVDSSQTRLDANRVFPIRVGDTFVLGGVVVRVLG